MITNALPPFYGSQCTCIWLMYFWHTGEWSVEDLWAGHDKLSEQVPTDSWLGRPLHPRQGTHQQCRGHEAVAILQGLNRVFPYLRIISTAIFRTGKLGTKSAGTSTARFLHVEKLCAFLYTFLFTFFVHEMCALWVTCIVTFIVF